MTFGYWITSIVWPHRERFCCSVDELVDFIYDAEAEYYTGVTGKSVSREDLRPLCTEFWTRLPKH